MLSEEDSDQLLVNLLKSQRDEAAKINTEALEKLHETHIKFLDSLGNKYRPFEELESKSVISVPEEEVKNV
jgi:hypothetical protein